MSTPFIILTCNRFEYLLFGINILPMRFRAILRRQPFSSSLSLTLISRPSQKRSFYNFCTRPLLIFVIWPKYATHAISRDSKTATFFGQLIAHVNISALPEHSFHTFRVRLLSIFIIWPKYTARAISSDSERATIFMRAIAHANIAALQAAHLL